MHSAWRANTFAFGACRLGSGGQQLVHARVERAARPVFCGRSAHKHLARHEFGRLAPLPLVHLRFEHDVAHRVAVHQRVQLRGVEVDAGHARQPVGGLVTEMDASLSDGVAMLHEDVW